MLLSVVINLLSSVYGTQSAPQAASPLGPSWRRSVQLIASGAEYAALVLRSQVAAASFRLRLNDFSIHEVLYCQTATFDGHCQLAHYRPPTSPSVATATVIYPISATRGPVDISPYVETSAVAASEPCSWNFRAAATPPNRYVDAMTSRTISIPSPHYEPWEKPQYRGPPLAASVVAAAIRFQRRQHLGHCLRSSALVAKLSISCVFFFFVTVWCYVCI